MERCRRFGKLLGVERVPALLRLVGLGLLVGQGEVEASSLVLLGVDLHIR